MNASASLTLRLSVRLAGFFLAFIAIYAGLSFFFEVSGAWLGMGDLPVVTLAAVACLLLWRIPLRSGRKIFSYRGSISGAVICCAAAATACTVQWPSPGAALVPVMTAVASVVLEEMVFRRAPVELLRRSGSADIAPKAAAGAISTGAFVLLHQNADPWLVADKAIFGLLAFCLTLITTSLALPVLLHLSSNLVLESAVQANLVEGSGALLVLDCFLLGTVVGALLLANKCNSAHLPRMTKAR